MALGLPNVNIVFKSLATAAIQQGGAGVLAIVLKDTSVSTGVVEYKLRPGDEIPAGLTVVNKNHIALAMIGTPAMVKVVVIPSSASDYAAAYSYLETITWNVGTVPGIAAGDVSAAATWAKGMYDAKDRKIMFVLPNHAGDHPAIVNFATDNILVGATSYTTTNFLARIAGLLAGLSLTVAPTYQVLPDVTDVPKLTKTDANTAIAAGKLILINDGEKVKIARGVTSLTTLADPFGAEWQKIKLVRVFNKIYTDIKQTIEDNYIGKVSNSYTNKLLLLNAVNAYYEEMELQGILDPGLSRADINIAAQRAFLKTILGADAVAAMNDQQVKEANTRDKVFIGGPLRALDAIEDFDMQIYL